MPPNRLLLLRPHLLDPLLTPSATLHGVPVFPHSAQKLLWVTVFQGKPEGKPTILGGSGTHSMGETVDLYSCGASKNGTPPAQFGEKSGCCCSLKQDPPPPQVVKRLPCFLDWVGGGVPKVPKNSGPVRRSALQQAMARRSHLRRDTAQVDEFCFSAGFPLWGDNAT